MRAAIWSTRLVLPTPVPPILAAYGDGEQDTGYAAAVDYADSIADGETVVLGLDVDRDGGLAVERLEQHE